MRSHCRQDKSVHFQDSENCLRLSQTQFTPPTRQDKTVLSCRCSRCELAIELNQRTSVICCKIVYCPLLHARTDITARLSSHHQNSKSTQTDRQTDRQTVIYRHIRQHKRTKRSSVSDSSRRANDQRITIKQLQPKKWRIQTGSLGGDQPPAPPTPL